MLVITRHKGESLYIGEDIKVTVLGTYKGQIKIGIDAPQDVNIAREELLNIPHLEVEG